MTILAEKDTKAERIEVRLSQNAKALLVAAANARHTSVSEFVLARAIEAAEQVVAVPRIFFATEQGWADIQRILDEEENQKPTDETISWLTAPSRTP